MLKEDLLEIGNVLNELTAAEQLALADVRYHVNERGIVSEYHNNISMAATVKLCIRMGSKIYGEWNVDLNAIGFTSIKIVSEARNRITHPKELRQMDISDDEKAACISALNWVMDLLVEQMEMKKRAVEALSMLVRDKRASEKKI